jgi:hypothetical protein
MEENDEEQITLVDLQGKMQAILAERGGVQAPYTEKHLKFYVMQYT